MCATAGGWPGTRADKLMDESMVVVCSPRLWPHRKRPTPKDVAKLPLIQMTTRPDAWRQWFRTQGLEPLVPRFFAEREIARGELITPSATVPFSSGLGYFLVHPEGAAGSPAFSAFRDWLLEQAAAYGAPAAS